jgi:undecaprenyl-phosphate galactose phosphotransferase
MANECEMSLVGPRPVTAEEVEAYGEHRDCYLQSRPGITGLWQVSGRNQLDFRRRVHLDAFYVQNWSLFRDIVILLMTIRVVFSRRGAY